MRLKQTLSGRGDKDVAELCEILPKWADKVRLFGQLFRRGTAADWLPMGCVD